LDKIFSTRREKTIVTAKVLIPLTSPFYDTYPNYYLWQIGLLDDRKVANRKHGDPSDELAPIERLAEIAPNIDEHRVVDTSRIVTAGGISSRIEMGFHLLTRFGYNE
jgi:transcriptional regulator GlxA family with amidase domain